MRYLVSFVCVLAGLAALPLSASAQAGEEAVPKVALAIHTQHRLPPQLMLRASYYLYLDADAEVATSESNLEEPVSSPAPATEVPDIDTLSQRSIEHYEIQSAQSGTQGGTGSRSRGAKAGIGVGVILGVGLVGIGIGAAVVMSNWEL